jgi:hypothetical protein
LINFDELEKGEIRLLFKKKKEAEETDEINIDTKLYKIIKRFFTLPRFDRKPEGSHEEINYERMNAWWRYSPKT